MALLASAWVWGQPLPWVMSMAFVGPGKWREAPLQSVVGTDFVDYDTSVSLPPYSSFKFGTQMLCVTLAKLLSFSVLQLPQP